MLRLSDIFVDLIRRFLEFGIFDEKVVEKWKSWKRLSNFLNIVKMFWTRYR